MKTVRSEWDDFAKAVLPPDCFPVQRQEMRRAFYAGARSMLSLMSQMADESPDEESGVKMVETLNQELRRFNEDVKGGRA